MLSSLASVVPGDPPAEPDVHDPEACRHEPVTPARRRKQRHGAKQHQTQTHHRDNPHRKGSASDDSGPVQQQPHTGEGGERPDVVERVGQEPADNDGRSKTQQKFSSGPGEEPGIGAVRLGCRGGRGDGHRDECFQEPNDEPGTSTGLPRSDVRRGHRGDAHGHPAPARHRGKFRGARHGFADVAKMVGGAGIDGDRLAAGRAHGTGSRHGPTLAALLYVCQVLCIAKCGAHLNRGLSTVAVESPARSAQAGLKDFRGYRPTRAFQRILKTSANICMLSRSMLTFVAGECPQRTGISTARKPWRRARYSNSGSKPNRSMVCCSKTIRHRSRRKALKPHWVSTKGSRKDMRTTLLNSTPANSRKGDWCTVIKLRLTAREPMATSKCSRASMSLSASSIGAERSASVNKTMRPRDCSTPWRTLKPLPRLRAFGTTRSEGSLPRKDSATAAVRSVEPSSTTRTSTSRSNCFA